MTITNKLRLSFAIFIGSLLIPTMVGLRAISAIKDHQQRMQDIADLSFTQMKLANTVSEVMEIEQLADLDALLAQVKLIQAQFSAQVQPLAQLSNFSFKEYARVVIEDEQNLAQLTQQLFEIRRNYLISNSELQQKLAEHHHTAKQFVELINHADDKSLIEALVLLNKKSSFALYNAMQEDDVNIWLEALAALREKMLLNPKLAQLQPKVKAEMAERRAFIVSMVETARKHQRFSLQEEDLFKQFIDRVNRNIAQGQHAKHQLIANIESTTEQTVYIKGAVLVLMLLVGIAISMYLTRSIASSVANMKRAVDKVSTGDLDYVMREKGKNEFSTLADAFNHMTGELKDSRLEMAQYNQMLEQRIEERTVELKHAIEKVELNNLALEKLSAQLSKYLSPQLFQSIFTGKQEVRLETSRKKLTVFFSDIQGFTQLTDTMDPEAMTMVLNVYLNAMTEIALEYGGTIDKFIGDAVMVFFGDPESRGDQADALACINMALAMRERLAQLRAFWQTQGYKLPFHIRIGINTGYCTVGNFGAEDRMDYTIIGGNVNLASRLESNAKQDQILISHTTQQLVESQIICQELNEISVKGIAKPVQTYAVLGPRDVVHNDNQIQCQQPGLDVNLDLSKVDRQQARQQLQAMLEELDRL